MDRQRGQLAAAHSVVIDGLGRAMALYGLPVALGRTYALLYLADAPLSVSEIAAQLGMTKGTVSVNVRLLERMRLLHQAWPPGRRGKFYVAERDLARAAADLMNTTAAAELATVTAALAESDRLLQAAAGGPDETTAARARADRVRIAALRAHYERSYALMRALVEALAAGQPAETPPEG